MIDGNGFARKYDEIGEEKVDDCVEKKRGCYGNWLQLLMVTENERKERSKGGEAVTF